MTNEEMLEQMKAMLVPLQEKVANLEEENKQLRGAVDGASGRGSDRNTAGRQVNMRAARSVFIATRPVQDVPDDPRWAGKVADNKPRSIEEDK